MAEHEANELRQLVEQDLRELMLLLSGIGDAAAGQRPASSAWSVKELLALLSERLRARFRGLALALEQPAVVLPHHAPPAAAVVRAIVVTCGSVTALAARCRCDLEDLANLVAEVPAEQLRANVTVVADGSESRVELLTWVREAFDGEFQDTLARVRALRDGAKG